MVLQRKILHSSSALAKMWSMLHSWNDRSWPRSSLSSTLRLVAPSLLSANFSCLGEELSKLERAGADWVHVDVMDGHFVPNLTWGAPVVKSLRRVTKLPLDVHLMIEKPEKLLNDFLEAGSDVITFHVESTGKMSELIETTKAHQRKVGITLRPGTPLAEVESYLDRVDLVLVMTVEPGFGGQKFMDSQISKVDRLAELRSLNSWNYLIEVDGGLNAETSQRIPRADVLVAGSYIFQQANYQEPIQRLKKVTS